MPVIKGQIGEEDLFKVLYDGDGNETGIIINFEYGNGEFENSEIIEAALDEYLGKVVSN